ncbi:MAG: serine hydroxymethyltransferase, partial [Erysipelotrichaceae bacterium]
GFRIVSGGTDNHLMLIDVMGSISMSGKQAEKLLDEAGITCNKNTIPFDQEKPFVTSGIRLGTPAMTTRGFKEKEFIQVGKWIADVLKHPDDLEYIHKIREEVFALTKDYPVEHA